MVLADGGARRWAAIALAGTVIAMSLVGCVSSHDPAAPATTVGSPSAEGPRPTPSDSGGERITAVLSIAAMDVDGQHVTVAGYVAGIIEGGGTCRYELASVLSGVVVTVGTEGISNARNTSCGSVQVPVGQLSKGPWSVSLTYVMPTNEVASLPINMEVP